MRRRRLLFKIFSTTMLIVFSSINSFADEQVGTSTSSLFSSVQKGFEELYSENSYYTEYNLVTDTRIRYYQPLLESLYTGIDAFVGANLQYQSPGAKEKYFDDSITPYVGVRGSLFKRIYLQFQAGLRSIINEDYSGERSQWDPRVILSAGDFWQWSPPQVFTEAYGESTFVPRLDSTPVSTLWVKQGYRFQPLLHLNLDPYAEFYTRDSRSADLGPSMTEVRLGLRTQWVQGGWNVAALMYHPFDRHDTHGDIEGLLVVGGIF